MSMEGWKEMKKGEPPLIGKNIQKIRKEQQLTLDILAEKSGVSKAMLSQIESEKVNPTVATVWKIARGLGVELDSLLKGKSESLRKFSIIRDEEISVLDTSSNGPHLKVLSPIEMAEDLEIYLLTFDKGSELNSKAHANKSEEYITVLEGRVRVEAGENVTDIKAGDFIMYHCDVDHSIRNISDGPSKIHLVVRFFKKDWA
jgi:transcriptional regulator with XRE-family HTH domain